MCDLCSDVLALLQSHDERMQDGEGLHLSKPEVMVMVVYAQSWQQRQCMCCFKDYKNYERINNLVQVSLNLAIKALYSLPNQYSSKKEPKKAKDATNVAASAADTDQKESVDAQQTKPTDPESVNDDDDDKKRSGITEKSEDKNKSENKDSSENDHDMGEAKADVEGTERKEEKDEDSKVEEKADKEKEEQMEVEKEGVKKDEEKKKEEEDDDEELLEWNMDEKDRLLQFVAKVFLMNFPLYMAYKHSVHSSLDELSQQEASALNNYCELSDPDIPVYLLRNVCFFCDSNGINAVGQCFEKANPESLPYTVAHTLITIIANLRLWMNIATVMQYIVPLRTPVIRYMCKLSDKDLRLAGTRNMTDLMWAAVKEPLETHVSFDKEGLDLAFKYFTCTTLTIRLAGITQINNQINMYNEVANNENLMEAESIGALLADWLTRNKIIEHIFGPNLHVEIIKQSQIILNFLAIENRITNEHVDCIWAAGQLKHCSKQVHDILIPLIKSLEVVPAHHLLKLVSCLEPPAHTEQTLYLASALIRFIWSQVSASHGHASLAHCTQQHYPILTQSVQKGVDQHNLSSDEHGESHETDGSEDEEEDPIIKARQKHKQKSLKKGDTEQKLGSRKHFHRGHRLKKERVDGETDGSSLCAKSELSNISDESLPSDMSEPEPCVHRHVHIHRHQGASDHHDDQISDVYETEIDFSETSDEEHSNSDGEICACCVQHQHQQQHHHQHHRSAAHRHRRPHHHGRARRVTPAQRVAKCHIQRHEEDEEEEEDDEEEESSEEEDEEEEEEFAESDEEKILAAAAAARKSVAAETANQGQEKDTNQKNKASTPGDSMQTEEAGDASDPAATSQGAGPSEVYDCRPYIVDHLHRHMQSDMVEDILSPDEGSCNSSHVSTKSEKNMADFEGEDVVSDDELASINAAHAHHAFSSGHMVSEEEMTPTRPHQHVSARQMQEHLVDFASLYHGSSKDILSHAEEGPEQCGGFNVEDVCHPGNTLLWDLVQEDTVHLLPEGLAAEAEKALHTLVCYTTDPKIKMQFIEACVENLANHKSVVVSLRLLPKLFSTFQPYRGGLDTYSVTMWAEKELGMMTHFFNNLVYSTEAVEMRLFPALYTRKEEIQVQLHFLSCIFSSAGSPDNFRLNLEQVDILWNCMATNLISSDECLHWFLQQAKSKDHHAMGLDTFKHIFCEKMPLLQPETISMTGLNLFTQLCQLANIANVSSQTPVPDEQVNGMNQLWGIALRAQNTDVSLTAIQYLNNYYINYGSGVLEKEDEFVTRCMSSLVTALSKIDQNPESNLLVIQRGLILLTNHLDSFRKRYAFHLRNWQLDNQGITSHQKGLTEKQCLPLRVVLQPAGASEKTTIEMLSTDLISELRSEVTRWWEALHHQYQLRQQQQEQEAASMQAQQQQAQGSVLTPILGAMLGDGPIRMITLGQELTADLDEKTLAEMQFKDLQLVFVSIGASRPPRKHDGSTPASYLTPPPREKLPMMLLLAEPHFGQIFGLLQDLSNLKCSLSDIDTQEELSLQTKARVLSRKVWELLMLLPTNPAMLSGFRSITHNQESCGDGHHAQWDKLLDQHSPHKLMYSLQIVESLSKAPKHRRRLMSQGGESSCLLSTDSEMSVDQDQPEEIWSRKFVSRGGLSHLFSIFLSGSLQAKDGDQWNEWNQECLGYLLRLLSQFAVCQSDQETGSEEVFDSYESPKKRIKKSKSVDKINIPRLNQTMLKMIEIDPVLKILMSILYDAALPRESNQWHIERWGRAEVVHYAMSFLVSWAHSSADVQPALCSSAHFSGWLKRLILEAPEPYVRQESCRGIYRLCLGRTHQGQTGYAMLLPLLSSLLIFLDNALKMKTLHKETPEEKEPYGPGCRDYFWLLCRLVESLSREDAENSWNQDESAVNLDSLARQVAKCIKSRGYLEKRPNVQEDNGLIGLLNLFTVVIKHKPPFHSSVEGQNFLVEMFWALFALPSPAQRFLPKCKSQVSRSAAYDLLVEMVKDNLENYSILHEKILAQHTKDSHSAYPWDHWPHEDGRSKCGYVGLTNLGATCYMATCMQHLYMIPQARKSVLEAKVSDTMPISAGDNKHEGTLLELKKMFAYLLESERKAYNPRSFCKVYTMDKQPLNTGEQKDMTEFFTDLISKLEEMSPELKKCVKNLFGGVITNNVVSLDCPHVSRTKEEFYTVRCQVADMKNLYESLDEVTVKDMLEGDNMYTCSKCQKKVRAEKRACFKTLPNILCFNTMRYTFNMVTMMKEKVNTHFSFPLRLDMTGYMEKHLIQRDRLADVDGEKEEEEEEREEKEGYEYELIGVTVHTGTADGGHYYSFIRDRINKNDNGQDKWYLFNDAEVKPFDPAQIATECFGGEMTSKTYDQVTDKFMDFSFEKTNSAYMLFYERYKSDPEEQKPLVATTTESSEEIEPIKFRINLSQDLAEWIWQDNMNFLQDKNIFEHTYFGFMWQMCGYIPTTLPRDDPEKRVSLMATKLSASFVLETLIHSKEKPTMLQWIELLTKLFNSCQAACEWFLEHMAENDWWPLQILIKCPNQVVRQMFQRLVIHVISQLKPVHQTLYLHPLTHSESEEVDMSQLGSKSCVTRFIKRMLAIIEHGVKPHSKHLTEYFAFLLEFAKMGEDECMFLIHLSAVTTMVNFYMGHKSQENYVEILSDEEEEEEEEVITLTEDKYRPQSLDKMISLISMLVEKSRGDDRQLNLTDKDYNSIVGGKGFPFLFSQIRDNINIKQTCNLIFSLCRWNDGLALAVVQMIFGAIVKLSPEQCQPFFKLLSMLAEIIGGPPGMPPFTQYVLQKVWEVADYCPQQCLEWLSTQVMRNKLAHTFTLRHMDLWVEPYLLAHNNMRVRTAAAALLVALVPSNHFRQAFRSTRSLLSPHKDLSQMTQDTVMVLHDVYEHLLRLMSRARHYVDAQTHGTMKLMSYFALMTYCLVSKTEKLMFSPFFMDLWTLFQPKLSEPPIPMNHNKQALLIFWYQVCSECPENVKLIVTNAHITKNIAFNYILADHDDQDVVLFNRCMLPAYYGILRMCCHQSRSFTRHLAQHQNIQWAFKNITPYPTQYTVAVEELFKMMRLMVTQFQDSSDDELKAIAHFRRTTIQLYLANLEARSGWQTLISAFKILIDSTEDQLLIIYHGGLCLMTEAFFTLHVMFHEATACHVTGDIVDLLALMQPIIRQARTHSEKKADMKSCLYNWKDRMEFVRKLLTLLNSYTPLDIRQITLDVLREMVLTFQNESLQAIVPILTHSHSSFQDHNMPIAVGPYFPKRCQKSIGPKANIRPPRPQFQMFLHSNQLEVTKGVDESYDAALQEFFTGYHAFIDLLCRVAANQQNLSEAVINLSAMVAYEGVPLHSPYFAKLWTEIYHLEQIDKNYIGTLCHSSFFIDYVDAVLLDERQSLNNHHIYQFFTNYFPKVHKTVMNDQGHSLLDSLVASITAEKSELERVQNEKDLKAIMQRINGDLRAMMIIFSVKPRKELTSLLSESLHYILDTCRTYQAEHNAKPKTARAALKRKSSECLADERAEKTEKSEHEATSSDEKTEVKEDEEEEGQRSEENGEQKNKSGETPSKRRRTTSHDENAGDNEQTEETGTKQESPATIEKGEDISEPGTSGHSEPGTSGQSEPKPGTSRDMSPPGTPEEKSPEPPRAPVPREKPGYVDLVARNVQHIFSMCGVDSDAK